MLEELKIPDMRAALEEGDIAGVVAFLNDNHPADSAPLLEALRPDESLVLLNALDSQLRADLFCELSGGYQADLAELLESDILAQLASRLSPDDRVDLLKSLPSEQMDEIMTTLAAPEREDVKLLASYPEGTAGAMMTSEYIALPADLTVAVAMERIRREAPKKESVYNSYIVDAEKRLLGKATLRDLILAEPEALLSAIMEDQVASVGANEDREEAVYKLAHYDLLDVPVLDEHGAMLGIITHDDAMDAMEDEHTEDMERFMAISGGHDETSYMQTSAWSHFKHRVLWLVILAGFGLVSGAILQSFEQTLASLIILAFYMPMLADTGGNTGSQSATVIIRALALKQLSIKDTLKVLWKELRIALLLCLVLGSMAFLRVFFFTKLGQVPDSMSMASIAFAIATALSIQVVSATVIGAALPLAAFRLGMDPALIASPMLATIVDITGLFIYFTSARLILGI
ncbi:MAG TPA: magnesium transporter [Spirochaetaceae bacterium]|jgi:magnesium transporter|nr:magnesium transporter [Spirochaetaceae bacterium]